METKPGLKRPIWCTLKAGMRRGIQITLSLLAVLMLVKPFDCFDSGGLTQKTLECCKRGKCNPSNGDDCCKRVIPGGKQLVVSKVRHRATFAPDLTVAVVGVTTAPVLTFATPTEKPTPSTSPPHSRVNLPLLV